MSERAVEIPKPRSDDRPLWDVIWGVYGCAAILIAHKLKVFPLLHERPRTLEEIGAAVGIARRPAGALMSVACSLGFARLEDGRYALTPLSEDCLLEDSPTYFGAAFDFTLANASVCSLEGLTNAILTNAPQVPYGGGDVFNFKQQASLARTMARAMHSISIGPALVWPDARDLSQYCLMLDIAGGSGAHSIGATLRWPNLKAVVFDLAPVCEVAKEFAARYELGDRITTQVGDMFNDPLPEADIHFYSNIYHDWPEETCRLLTGKSFQSVRPGGRVILHEMLYNDDKTGPFAAAAHSMSMMGWTKGRQYSGRELSEMLTGAGFRDVVVKPIFGYYSIVSAVKPKA